MNLVTFWHRVQKSLLKRRVQINLQNDTLCFQIECWQWLEAFQGFQSPKKNYQNIKISNQDKNQVKWCLPSAPSNDTNFDFHQLLHFLINIFWKSVFAQLFASLGNKVGQKWKSKYETIDKLIIDSVIIQTISSKRYTRSFAHSLSFKCRFIRFNRKLKLQPINVCLI